MTIVGSNLGGRGNTAYAYTDATTSDLVRELRSLLPQLERFADDPERSEDIQAVRTAMSEAERGRREKAMTALRGVGAWVARIAERAGTQVVADIITGSL